VPERVLRRGVENGDAMFYLFGIIWIVLLIVFLAIAYAIIKDTIRHH
jgi:hypothetical protein